MSRSSRNRIFDDTEDLTRTIMSRKTIRANEDDVNSLKNSVTSRKTIKSNDDEFRSLIDQRDIDEEVNRQKGEIKAYKRTFKLLSSKILELLDDIRGRNFILDYHLINEKIRNINGDEKVIVNFVDEYEIEPSYLDDNQARDRLKFFVNDVKELIDLRSGKNKPIYPSIVVRKDRLLIKLTNDESDLLQERQKSVSRSRSQSRISDMY